MNLPNNLLNYYTREIPMKKYILYFRFFAILLILNLLTVSCIIAQKKPKDQFTFPPLNKIEVPKVQKVELKNGMKLYLVEDHQYPTIDMRAMINVGSIYEPADKIGLASLTGTVLRTGGTEKRDGDEIDRLLETLGATVETDIGEGSGYIYVSVLKEDIDKGIDILADILIHPAFRQEKIDLAKIEARSGISRRNDNVLGIANREFNSLIYGKTHPYARYEEYATIDAITRDDMVSLYKKYFHPNNMIFAAWGDFDVKEFQKKIENAFNKWKASKIEFPPKPQVDYKYKYTINFIQKSDLNQSNILMGHIGGLLNDPDYPALTIMNQILSYERMFKVIRSQEGLTYSPWGYFGADYDHPDVFNCGTQTKSKSTIYAIRLMLKEIKRITEEEVTDEELTRAKESYLNSFVFSFDSKAKIVNRMLTYAYYDYPLDFIDKIKEGVEKVTKADILRVAKKHLHPDELQILVVGKKEDFDEPLSVLGKVNEIDITIPTPKAELPKASAEGMKKGKELIETMVEKMGGKKELTEVKNYSAEFKTTHSTPMGEFSMDGKITIVYPNKVHMMLNTPQGEITMVLSDENAWLITPQGKMPAPTQVKEQMIDNMIRDPIYLNKNLSDFTVQYIGEANFADKPAFEILITRGEKNYKLYLDKVSSLPVGIRMNTVGQQGPTEMEERYSDYRNTSGIMYPYKTTGFEKGKKMSEMIISKSTFNGTVDMKLFENK
jgi:predicted Zn-dependent peptidase/outer membrane lipoprotein-sorting protein